jgi:hypothetical protein
VTSRWRKVVYGLITFYVCASVPGHVRYLLAGNTSYFDIFPWWFSLVIMPVYLLVIAYFFTLPPPSAVLVHAVNRALEPAAQLTDPRTSHSRPSADRR